MPRKAKSRTLFAERVALARKSRGLSQSELAKMTGVSPRVIGLYETVIKNPTPDICVRIAKALGVSIDELMGHKPVKAADPIPRNIIKSARLLASLSPTSRKTVLNLVDALQYKKAKKASQ